MAVRVLPKHEVRVRFSHLAPSSYSDYNKAMSGQEKQPFIDRLLAKNKVFGYLGSAALAGAGILLSSSLLVVAAAGNFVQTEAVETWRIRRKMQK